MLNFEWFFQGLKNGFVSSIYLLISLIGCLLLFALLALE